MYVILFLSQLKRYISISQLSGHSKHVITKYSNYIWLQCRVLSRGSDRFGKKTPYEGRGWWHLSVYSPQVRAVILSSGGYVHRDPLLALAKAEVSYVSKHLSLSSITPAGTLLQKLVNFRDHVCQNHHRYISVFKQMQRLQCFGNGS